MIHMKCQAFFSLKSTAKKLKMSSASVVISISRVKQYFQHPCYRFWKIPWVRCTVILIFDDMLKNFLIFSQKTGFDISCKLSPMDGIFTHILLILCGDFFRKVTITWLSVTWQSRGYREPLSRPRWLRWMCRPTRDQEVAGSTPAEVGNILLWRLITKYFLWSFSPFRWFKKGSCQFLAKESAQYWLTA